MIKLLFLAATLTAPFIILFFLQCKPQTKHFIWLLFAGIASLFSWQLYPSTVLGQFTDTFWLHFIGAGVVFSLIGYFISLHLDIAQKNIRQRLAIVAATAFTLMVASELFEVALIPVLGIEVINDTSWDLLANTTGLLVSVMLIEIVIKIKTLNSEDVA